jgi:phenylalanine-4-hydroxylase
LQAETVTSHRDEYDLPQDHPGFSDRAYRSRRARIAAVAETYEPGSTIPDVPYTDVENEVWATVSRELAAKHERLGCQTYRDAAARMQLPRDRVPQLQEVNERLQELTGFQVRPVAGLVPARDFYGALADRTFFATQYVRHHSVPFYTPEPDVIHELIGHVCMLGSPAFADLYELAGAASRRTTTDDALEFFSRVFWFTIEFGVVREDGELRAYGAGLLSSYGELDAFREAELHPWDIDAMGTTEYDITRYQPLIFATETEADLVRDLSAFFRSYGEEDYRSRIAAAHVRQQHVAVRP